MVRAAAWREARRGSRRAATCCAAETLERGARDGSAHWLVCLTSWGQAFAISHTAHNDRLAELASRAARFLTDLHTTNGIRLT
mmetsp:Transcript_3998/g.9090  ORF Transcript_3998/g.9090 Transcript_3998/m.9090 type:complete len:83 (+) Transcript_3998:2-250(+)